jgi:hypothetical protein
MSAFNRLRARARCPNCGQVSEQVIQFKFGDAWQYEYAVGDALRWGGNDIGRPGLGKVIVFGAGEECPVCHRRGEDFSVVVERDVITGVEEAPDGPPAMTNGELFHIAEDD